MSTLSYTYTFEPFTTIYSAEVNSNFNAVKTVVNGNLDNSNIASGAAIAYSKLNLAGSIVNADISNSAAIAYAKLALTAAIVNADISASAAIAYSKLNLASSIVNADVSASAAIALSKLATATASRAVETSAGGILQASSVTSTELARLSGVSGALYHVGGTDVAQADGGTGFGTYTKGDILYASATDTLSKLGIGTTGQGLKVSSSGVPEWGAAGGAGGINYLGLNSSWQLSSSDDRDAEASVGNFAAYADAAATSPVDMTGGSPNTTIARTTTGGEILNGSASFKVTVSSGATRQGEGVSCVAYIPPGYRTANHVFKGQFKIASGTVSDGDFVPFVYDVTNSEVITPVTYSKILGDTGTFYAVFATKSTCAQIRAGIHIARASNTGAVTLLLDDLSVGPSQAQLGLAGSNWTSYTLTIGATTSAPTLGTTAVNQARWRRVGDSMEIHYQLRTTGAGSAGTGTYLFPLPSGYSIDSSKVTFTANDTTNEDSGVGFGSVTNGSTRGRAAIHAYNSTNLYASVVTQSGETLIGSAGYALSAAQTYNFRALVPISGWDANVQMGESSGFWISSYLANGTRVTGSAPTSLGQYRSYLRQAGASTYTETNGSPTATPTAADGFRLYNGNAWANADTNNEPTRYEIFVGKNKHPRLYAFSSTGRTGNVDIGPQNLTSTNSKGYESGYDPTTGIFWINAYYSSGSETAHTSGRAALAAINDPYADIFVSENALAVGVNSVRSMVRLDGGNGHGGSSSGETSIRNFTNITESIGTAITYTARTTTTGDKFTINEDGVYAISYSDFESSGTLTYFGVSKNSASLSTSVASISASERLIMSGTDSTTGRGACAWTGILRAGDVIRAHTAGAVDNNATVAFTITKVAN